MLIKDLQRILMASQKLTNCCVAAIISLLRRT